MNILFHNRNRVLLNSLSSFTILSLLLGAFIFFHGAHAASASTGTTRNITSAGTVSPQTGSFVPSGSSDVTQAEFPGQLDGANGPSAYSGTIVNRSNSNGTGKGVSVSSSQKAKSNPQFKTGFEGLNHYQQRYARGGNQFSLEPPDQGLCVGNGYVVETVNDVFNVYNPSGQSLLPDNTATNIVASLPRNVNHAVDLNSFFGYAPAINRSTGVRGQFVTDPSCLFDTATQRFFLVALTLETVPSTGAFTTVNHLDIAVSQTSNPTGSWMIYRVDVTNDGTNTGGVNPGPYLGDYPHIGADANGFYITTNAYPWCCNGFSGAQIYAFSKAQLAANAAEFFMSSNAADEATHPVAGFGGTHTSSQLIVWTLANTSSLNSASPSIGLSNRVLGVNQYAIPPKQQQPGSGTPATVDTPQGYCINDTTTPLFNGAVGCWRLLFGSEPAHNEVISTPDSNDTRMQQVMYANGKLWGALDTAINPDGGAQRAGVAWFIVNPNAGKVVMQGDLGAAGYDFTYPAIGVTAGGRGVMAFTATGDALNPSAAYAPIDALVGVGSWSVVPGGQGAAADDGFTSYKAQVGNPPRTRWGDYGAAAVDGNSIWIASEYIAHACNYSTWGGPFFSGGSGDNLLGTCAGSPGGVGVRSALGNWSTRISKLTP